MAELPSANLVEFFLYFSSTFLYLQGPVMKALDPRCLAPKLSRQNRLSNTCLATMSKGMIPKNESLHEGFDGFELEVRIEHAEITRGNKF